MMLQLMETVADDKTIVGTIIPGIPGIGLNIISDMVYVKESFP